MEPKKTERANLENKRGLFLQTGLILTLGLILVAFEWYSPQKVVAVQNASSVTLDELDPTVITRPEQKKLPPPPKVVYDEIIIVDNDDLESLIEIQDLNFDDFDFKNLSYIQEKEEPTPFWKIEKKPTYKGGDETLFWKDVNSRLSYPLAAQEMGIEGVVYVSFVVDKTGKMVNIEIVRSDEPIFNNEVIRVLSSSDNWTPGYQRDKAVSVTYTMSFKFELLD